MSDLNADDALPAAVYLDTGVLVAGLIDGTPGHAPCQLFLSRLARHRSQVYFAQAVWIELAEVINNLPKPYHGTPTVPAGGRVSAVLSRSFRFARWEHEVGVRRDWLTANIAAFEMWLQAVPWEELATTEELLGEGRALMPPYFLGAMDALHVATALRLGVSDIATLDRHFLRVAAATDLRLWNPTRPVAGSGPAAPL